MNLEPIEPKYALELYLADRENNVSQATIYSHRSRLGHFIRWCQAGASINNLNELFGRQLHEFRIWRRIEGDLSKTTEKTQMDKLRGITHALQEGWPIKVGSWIAVPYRDDFVAVS